MYAHLAVSLILPLLVPHAAGQNQCPSVWGTVAADLKTIFAGDDGCTDDARAAIRLPFHDCFPGACDGSIILSDECTSRGENAQLIDICSTIGAKATQYNVSTADMIQVAGAVAIAACPPGPTLQIKVGRTDVATANPTGQIPSPSSNATVLIAQFAAKGFDSGELVALVGSHSAGKNLTGTQFDTTPGSLDSTTFYSEVLDDTQPATLFSDQSLATDDATSADWREYADSQSTWNTDFAAAMEKMAVLGVDESTLVDCTDTIFAAI
ncbi:hypothetical protein N8I77_000017 [Diaporthe amygdali]|uniref:Peroxidase n=1 Tax=Phomopsis amygdali TaxID=1214568 RepID=A0AAD9SLF3_PHOAM|nr:hypothetical protein N8I77_000017 [Diaporthe amygdali]